ncbi:hypothetical protein BHE90_012533 [Fusarium euwallaceae]|uniref:Nucleoside phosphorylase domain-containing protein n=1 Tax=Fusarium euwallaceae TaxID=1147111 RepID=A0A430LBJ7_9HYPO|nr:hypothetical protein BHE90_012533 [Fusarium euwallaceae]
MLDQEHERLSHQHRNDENSYVLGSIKQHNIVMPVLPEYGISSATSAVKSMISTFPKLRFVLMVGIGGGVPSKRNDIRLGDVVVSEPDGQGGGVIQYDMGRMEFDTFVRVGVMNKPPKLLLSTLRTLRSDPKQGKNLSKILKKALEKFDDQEYWAYPGSKNDILFKPDYPHRGGDDCDACNQDQNAKNMVERKPRKSDNPKIHYGNIGSGNMVMKDALMRDKIAEKENVSCFEMEAAGLMNEWPCLVIRGISDYADSHKNGNWKQYAAVAAAAYARMLLLDVPLEKVEELEQVREVVQGIRADVDTLVGAKHDRDAARILEWLTLVDYAPQHNDLFRQRQPGTGQWFLDSPEFKEWAASEGQTLFCHGIPGAGKTLITSIVIDHLCQQYGSDPKVGIAYIYFNFRKQDIQQPEELLLSLLKQLAQRSFPLPSPVTDLFGKHEAFRTRPTLEAIIETICDVCSKYSKTSIVIDALDECGSLNLSKFLDTLLKLQEDRGVNIFATSRFKPEDAPVFRNCLSLEIRATDEDILMYLQDRMQHECPDYLDDNDLRQLVKRGVLEAATGMFLLAKFQTDSLLSQSTKGHLLDALKSLGKGEQALDDAYDEIMKRITNQKRSQKEMAIEALQWIVYSKSPLAPFELLYALAIGKGQKRFDSNYIPRLADLMPLFSGLVVVDRESDIIRLAHQTAQEYFDRKKSYFPRAASIITKACIQYLLSDISIPKIDGWIVDELDLVLENPFYGYAALNWGHHARDSFKENGTTQKALNKRVMTFLNSGVNAVSSFQILQAARNGIRLPASGLTGLHVAAFFGLVDQVRTLLGHSYDEFQADALGMTPLLWAIGEGHTTVVKLFLATGRTWVNWAYPFKHDLLPLVDPSVQEVHQAYSFPGLSFRTLLTQAIEGGFLDIVEILLDSGAETEYAYCKPLHVLGAYVKETQGMDISIHRRTESRFGSGRQLNASSLAGVEDLKPGYPPVKRPDLIWFDQDELREFCDLANGEMDRINYKPIGIRTPLSRAAELGHKAIVKLLLDHGARVELKEQGGKDAMTRAKEKGHWDILRLLVENRGR